MKRLYTIISSVILLMLMAPRANANHVLGGELYYQYQSTTGTSQTYKVIMSLFADCGSANSTTAFGLLSTATPIVNVYNNNAFSSSLTLTNDASLSNIEITPVCPGYEDSTNCTNLFYAIPGIKKFVYTTTVTLATTSANWRFSFEGNLINSTAGRSTIIGNINTLGGAQSMYLEATLNNTTGTNSSTEFTALPTPFFCINTPQGYNLGAIDPNNDSLSFSLIPAKVSNTINATYIAPYTGAIPVPAAAGTFNFSTTNGQLNFTPNISMNSVVVNLVDEYRNGVKVGSSMREMTFVILANCANSAPATGSITGLTNGAVSGTNVIEVCQGMTDTLRFNFASVDPNGDTVNITYSSLPPGATATITNNNTPSPQFFFKWNIANVAAGNYTFYVTVEDDGCPLASRQTFAYTVAIGAYNGQLDTSSFAGCKGLSNTLAWIRRKPTDTLKYHFTWSNANGNIVQADPGFHNGDTLSGAAPGIYTVQILNQWGCTTAYQITIPAPEYQAGFTVDTLVCVGENVVFTNTSTGAFTGYNWRFGDGATASGINTSHIYNDTGRYEVRMIGTTPAGCFDTVYTHITVQRVDLTVSNDKTICEGERTRFFIEATPASGTVTYSWSPTTGLSCTTCTEPWANPTDTTTYIVTGTNAAGCADKDTVVLNVVPTRLLTVEPDTVVCAGDSVHLRATGALAYTWTPRYWLSDTTSANPVAYPPTTMIYTVYGKLQHTCIDTVQIRVTIAPAAVINLPDTAVIYPGESYQLNPQGNCFYYQWFPPLGLSDANTANPIATPPVNTRYFATGVTEWGCTTLDSMEVLVQPETLLDIPNAFTPGSAPNDKLTIIKRGIATLKDYSIYNRWGQKVFQTNNISEGWDGALNGSPQPMGVYIYQVEAYTNTGIRFVKHGNVTLIR